MVDTKPKELTYFIKKVSRCVYLSNKEVGEFTSRYTIGGTTDLDRFTYDLKVANGRVKHEKLSES